MFENYGSYLSAAEVADELNVSCSTVYNLVKRGEIPCIKIGRVVRFERAGLIKAFEKMRLQPIEEVADGKECPD